MDTDKTKIGFGLQISILLNQTAVNKTFNTVQVYVTMQGTRPELEV